MRVWLCQVVEVIAVVTVVTLVVALFATGLRWIPGVAYLAIGVFSLAHAYRKEPPAPYGFFLAGAMLALGFSWLLWEAP
jgi:hypothetical protein